ncbi:N-6 DNA methylase [uncultured Desulfobacter sp.]|uniref:N-6 DNA methylase n=1 Tax=uncultured Desulfobacter sp. TaxID=240139 RepID=UPI002AAAB042|nr:N-6 DNA methylase [uncultured Desulfobacter sp.]
MTAVHFGNKEVLRDAVLQRLLQHFNKYSLKNKDLYTPDLLGDAYEYLIKMFADDAGKKGGEFYTPKGVVRLIVQLIKPEQKNSVYDPACGSGGMLVEIARYIAEQGGKVGIVLPHGVLFRAGSEGKIRQGILKDDILETVVGLPSKLFYNTGIPASIFVVNKAKPEHLKNKVIFIDASQDFKEGKNQNRLEEEHVKKIVDAYDGGDEIDKYMRVVDMAEIKANDFNLNIARYIDTSEEEKPVDLVATLASIKEIEKQEEKIDAQLAGYLKELGL